MADRTYAVGLPVIITVRDDGFVTMSVDLSEAGVAIRKDWDPAGDDQEISDAQLVADATTVERWTDLNTLEHGEFAPGFPTEEATCRHCGRRIIKDAEGRWVDPEATGDDSVWRETCDEHDTFTAEHEPFRYKETHTSTRDGSPAMLVRQDAETITLVNECGDEWTDPLDQWAPIEPGKEEG